MESVKNPYERSSVLLCFLSIICFVIILIGILWMAVSSFLRGDIGLGLLMIGGEGILLFFASIFLYVIGKQIAEEMYVGM
jgi:hypothetical protein